MTLREKDIDFDLRPVTVRSGKGIKDYCILLSKLLIPEFRHYLSKVEQLLSAENVPILGQIWDRLNVTPHDLM